jgi:hypothetical protein
MRDERTNNVPAALHAMLAARLAAVVRELRDRRQGLTCLPACGGAA